MFDVDFFLIEYPFFMKNTPSFNSIISLLSPFNGKNMEDLFPITSPAFDFCKSPEINERDILSLLETEVVSKSSEESEKESNQNSKILLEALKWRINFLINS